LFTLLIPSITVDLSFYPLLNAQEPLVDRYLKLNKELQLGKRLFVLLEGKEETLPEALITLKEQLEKRPDIEQVLYPPTMEWVEENAPWAITDKQFESWVSVSSNPKQLDLISDLQKTLEEKKSQLTKFQKKTENSRVALVILAEDPMNQTVGKSSYIEIEKYITKIMAEKDIATATTGLPAITSEDQARTFDRMKLLSPLSLLFVLLLLRTVEKRISHLLLISIPMLAALGATVGIVGSVTGKITMLETVFGVMIFGLGVDFALHLISRMREERQNHSLEIALQKTLSGTGKGVIVGGITTIGAFAIISTAPDPEALHLGLSGSIGLMLCLILMITVLPAAWVLLDKNNNLPPAKPLDFSWIAKLTNLSVQYPGKTVIFLFAFSGSMLLGFKNFHIQTDLQKIFNREVPALEANRKLQQRYGFNYNPWVFQAETMEDVRRIQAAAEKVPFISRVDSLALIFPKNAKERHRRLVDTKQKRLLQKKSTMSMISVAALRGDDRVLDLLRGHQLLEKAEELGPPQIDSLPDFLKTQLITKTGKHLVLAYPQKASLDGEILHLERLELEKIDPNVASLGTAVEGVLFVERPWLTRVFSSILVFVTLLLYFDNRNFRYIILTLLPVFFGCSTTFGILCWLNLEFNPITLMALPLILGLGIDDGIHVVHRMREEPEQSASQAAIHVGNPILMTTLTSCASFGTLLLTDHPGMESMALVLIIGLPLCLIASITLLPAAAVLMKLKSP